MIDDGALRQQLCDAARQLWTRGLIVGSDGMLTVEQGRRRFLVTPPGQRRSDLVGKNLPVVDIGGSQVQGMQDIEPQHWQPHRVAYQSRAHLDERDDPSRMVHATALVTPPHLTAMQRIAQQNGCLKLTDRSPLPVVHAGDETALRQILEQENAVIIKGVGLLCIGSALDLLLNEIERIEHDATIDLASRRFQ